MKALTIAAALLGLSAAALPAHAFQAAPAGAIATHSADVVKVGWYDRYGNYHPGPRYYDREYYGRRYRDDGWRGRGDWGHRGDWGQRGDWGRGPGPGPRPGWGGGPNRPDAVIVTPNRPGTYQQGGVTVRQY